MDVGPMRCNRYPIFWTRSKLKVNFSTFTSYTLVEGIVQASLLPFEDDDSLISESGHSYPCTCQSFDIHAGPFNYDAHFDWALTALWNPFGIAWHGPHGYPCVQGGEGFLGATGRLGGDRLNRDFYASKLMQMTRRVWYKIKKSRVQKKVTWVDCDASG